MNSEQKIQDLNPMSKDEEIQFQQEVLSLIDEKIRPALMMDGGDMAVERFEKIEGTEQYRLLVKLVGACGSCPSAGMTMKMGVERMLVQNFPQIAEVEQTA